jgi:hypothetical protein
MPRLYDGAMKRQSMIRKSGHPVSEKIMLSENWNEGWPATAAPDAAYL